MTLEPAFPVNPPQQLPGMTIRDYFAAHALIGLLAEPFVEGAPLAVEHLTKGDDGSSAEMYAIAAYKLSDALIKERAKAEDSEVETLSAIAPC